MRTRLHVVSDVHGRTDALARSLEGADALVCLGDLVLFIDYDDLAAGIFPGLFGSENTRTYVALRTAGRFDEARDVHRRPVGGPRRRPARRCSTAVRAQYAETFAAMPEPAYLTYGNVDLPDLWPELPAAGSPRARRRGRRDRRPYGRLRRWRAAHRLPDAVRDHATRSTRRSWLRVEGADILCTHIPPALPELTYDVVARRFERGSVALLDVDPAQPAAHVALRPRPPAARRPGRGSGVPSASTSATSAAGGRRTPSRSDG